MTEEVQHGGLMARTPWIGKGDGSPLGIQKVGILLTVLPEYLLAIGRGIDGKGGHR